MELLNPRMTVQNAVGPIWLVRLEHRLNDEQFIDVQVVIQRTEASLPAVQREVLQQVVKLMEHQIQRLSMQVDKG